MTRTDDQIRLTKDAFRVYAEGVNHSSSFYVLDPSGQFRRQISAESSIADLTSALRNAMTLERLKE